jgi:hypothetical protein
MPRIVIAIWPTVFFLSETQEPETIIVEVKENSRSLNITFVAAQKEPVHS